MVSTILFSTERIRASIDESLTRLRTDYLDRFKSTMSSSVISADRRRNAAVQPNSRCARFIGITGYPPKMLIRLAEQFPVDTILSYCHYNPMCTDMDSELMPFARTNSIGLINASGLHMGALTEGGPPDWHPAPAAVKEAAQKAAELCRHRGKIFQGIDSFLSRHLTFPPRLWA
jgi:L-galactose dehydrogenase